MTRRWWDLPSAIFLIVAIMTTVARLYSTQWTSGLDKIEYLTLFGLILGLALGQSKFSVRSVQLIGFTYTLFVVPWQLTATQTSESEWTNRLASLIGRLSITTNQFVHHHVVDDSILFVTLMAVLFWLLGVTAGYSLVRYGNPWTALLPSGLALFIIDHYDSTLPSGGRFIGTYLFFTLLIIGRLAYLRYKNEWQERGIVQAPETGVDFGKAALIAVIILVLLTWTAPALASGSESARQLWDSISHPWDTVRNRFSDAVATLKGSAGVVADFYGDQMQLGTGTHLGDDIVMTINASSPQLDGSRYYWRARSYDTYSSEDGWHTTISSQSVFNPKDSEIKYPDWKSREPIQFTFQSKISQLRTVYTGPAPLWMSRASQLIVNYGADGSVDIATVQATPPIRAGETYQVRSWISLPGVSELQSTGDTYPEWVSDHYLQLPSGFSPKVQDLARTITAGSKTPYDKAQAITDYLRSHITYQTSVPSAPIGEDPIEYFLFTTKAGFCNYYASAEVLMLRSLGIPARLSVGFAQGDKQTDGTTFVVRYRDAHAWPEVYFNGIGWVEFEPTVSQPVRELPAVGLSGAINADGSTQLPDVAGGVNRQRAIEDTNLPQKPGSKASTPVKSPSPVNSRYLWIGIGLGGCLLAFAGWNLLRRRYTGPAFPVLVAMVLEKRGIEPPKWLRKWAFQVSLSPLQKAYNVMNLSLRFLGKPSHRSTTPMERAANLSRLIPPATEPAVALVSEYEREQYSKAQGNIEKAQMASKYIRRLTIQSLINRILRREE